MVDSAALLVDEILPEQPIRQWVLKALTAFAGQALACIEDPAVIERILAHLNGKAPSAGTALRPEDRAPPPQARLFD